MDEASARNLKNAQKKSWTWHTPRAVEKLSITSAMREIYEQADAHENAKAQARKIRSKKGSMKARKSGVK